MRMHPVCPNLICKIWSIIECVTRWYSAIINSMHSRVLPLSDPINPIKVGSSRLVNSMCVDGDILHITKTRAILHSCRSCTSAIYKHTKSENRNEKLDFLSHHHIEKSPPRGIVCKTPSNTS